VNVALGSESLACNSTIDMVEEMRQVRMEGKVHVNAILEMATLNGARALGLDDKIGSLSPGKFADWVAVEVPAGAGHPIEGALTLGGKVIESSLAGEVVCQNA
jgi:5-methylthioadenosine/S-adenosylhomocysteine deaminase